MWKKIDEYHIKHSSGHTITWTPKVNKPFVLWKSDIGLEPLGFFTTLDEAKQEHERIAK